MELQNELESQTYALFKQQGSKGLTDAQKEAYTTVGGTPRLDGQYTVFGEVEEGLDIVEKIQATSTLPGDRPKEDIIVTQVELV